MDRSEPKTNHIDLEAPDDIISGLLGVYAAEQLCLSGEEMLPRPDPPGLWRLVAVQRGTVYAAGEDGAYTLEPMQAMAVSGSLTLRSEGDCALTVISLAGEAADRLLGETAARGGLFFPKGGDAVLAVYRALAVRQEHGAPVPAGLASGEAYQMLIRLYGTGCGQAGPDARTPRVVADAMDLMQREFAFLDGIGDLAGRLGLSQEYLTRTFRACTGVTPGKYLTRLRVEHAKLLLGQQGHTVAFVSDACGFSNGNYFARVFRQFTGMNPGEYARSVEDASGVQPGEYARSVEGVSPPPDGIPDSFYVL